MLLTKYQEHYVDGKNDFPELSHLHFSHENEEHDKNGVSKDPVHDDLGTSGGNMVNNGNMSSKQKRYFYIYINTLLMV